MIRNHILLFPLPKKEPSKYLSTLNDIKDICIALDMEQKYMDFYLLNFAKNDLNELDTVILG